MADVFISYNHCDGEIARAIQKHLERRGCSVFNYAQNVAGRIIVDVVNDALHDAEQVIVLWSANAKESGWVAWEAEIANSLMAFVVSPSLLATLRRRVAFALSRGRFRAFAPSALSRFRAKTRLRRENREFSPHRPR